MGENRLRNRDIAAIIALSSLTLGAGLGRTKLSYHEAIGAQSARELIAGGDPAIPTIDGRPWLEKPPLCTWPIAGLGKAVGGIDELIARAPSAVAASALCLIVAGFAARRFGSTAGLIAGSVQATSAWLVTRGRLAEVDVLLAALVAGAIVAFEGVRSEGRGLRKRGEWTRLSLRSAPPHPNPPPQGGRGPEEVPPRPSPLAPQPFFALLGLTSLAKGVGFGAALIGATAAVVLIWDRDGKTLRKLASPTGWAVAALLTLAWPMIVAAKYPEAVGLWAVHISDRFASRPERFAGESWREYALSPIWQTLPWTPLAIVGAIGSWSRAKKEPGGADRLLWAWAVAPAALVSMASVRNAHYLIHALPPVSIWASLALIRLGDRLRGIGWSPATIRRRAIVGFASLGAVWAIGLGVVAPRLEKRGAEWAFYGDAGQLLDRNEPLILLYDWPEWDRFPYPTPFGPMPHDLAVRLFYLDRPASWRVKSDPMPRGPFAVIARRTDAEALGKLGRVEVVAEGPTTRWDRAYRLYRVGDRGPSDAGIAGRIGGSGPTAR